MGNTTEPDENHPYTKLKAAVDKAEQAITDKDKAKADEAVSDIAAICEDDAAVEAIAEIDGGAALLEQAGGIGEKMAEAFPEEPQDPPAPEEPTAPKEPQAPEESLNPEDFQIPSTNGIRRSMASTFALGNRGELPEGVAPVTVNVQQFDSADTGATPAEKNNLDGSDDAPFEIILSADDKTAYPYPSADATPVTFSLIANKGWVKTGVSVYAEIANGESAAVEKVNQTGQTADGTTTYTVDPNLTKTVKDENNQSTTWKYYSGDITIRVTGTRVKDDLKLSAALDSGTAYRVVNNAIVEADTIGTTATTWKIPYDAEGEVSVALPKIADKLVKYQKITVDVNASGGDTAKDIFAAADTIKKGEVDYCVYTFKPSEVPDYDPNGSNTITIVPSAAEAAKTLSLEMDTDCKDAAHNGKWLATAATLADAASYDVITAGSPDSSSGAVALDKYQSGSELTVDDYKVKTEGATSKKRVIAIKAAGVNNYKLNDVYGVLTDDQDNEVGDKITSEVKKNSDGSDSYVIFLDSIEEELFKTALTLTVKADVALDEEKLETVHTVTFTGDTDNVEISHKGADAGTYTDLKGTTYQDEKKSVTFKFKAKPGYTITKGKEFDAGAAGGATNEKSVVTVSYDKVYILTPTGGSATVKATVPRVENKEYAVGETADDTLGDIDSLTLHTDAASEGDTEWTSAKLEDGTTVTSTDYTENGGKAGYYLTNITIHVETEASNENSGIVTIDSPELDYSVEENANVIKRVGDKYEVTEDALFVTLTVLSSEAPSVTYGTSSATAGGTVAEKNMTKVGSGYQMNIPVSELYVDSGKIDSTITIAKPAKGLFIFKKVGTADPVKFNDTYTAASGATSCVTINGTAATVSVATGDTLGQVTAPDIKRDMTANIALTAPDGQEFTKITVQRYTNDATPKKDGEPTEIALGTDRKKAEFALLMDCRMDVVASVEDVWNWQVGYTYKGEAKTNVAPMEDTKDSYEIPFGSTDITMALKKGTSDAAILYAKAYDGDLAAATKVNLTTPGTSTSATIASINKADTGVLRVDLAANDTKKVVASLKFYQKKPAEKLVVKDADKNTVSAISLVTDSKVMEYTLDSADNGSVTTALENIDVEMLKSDGKTWVDGPNITTDELEAKFNKAAGTFTVQARPAMKGAANAGVIRFYDKAKRTEAKKSKDENVDKECLVAEPISVTTLDASIIGEAPIVRDVNSNAKVLKLGLSTSEYVVNPADNGSMNRVFYKIEVAEGELTGTGTKKIHYVEKTLFGKNNEQFYELTVDGTTVGTDKDGNATNLGSAKPYVLNVELVQTTTAAGTAANEAKVTADEAAKKLIHSGVTRFETETRNPNYEANLKLKPNTVTVYTKSQQQVLTRAEYSKETGYRTIATLQFVHTGTGLSWGAAGTTNVADTSNSNLYRASIDSFGDIKIGCNGVPTESQRKDLGLKVTVVSADGAYKSSAIVKINTVNGVNTLEFVSGGNRTLFKQSGKPATMKLTAVFNSDDKKNAPKNKQIKYSLVTDHSSCNLDTGVLSGTLDSAVKAAVTVNEKNGTINVDKNFVVNKDTAKNKFCVKAEVVGYKGIDPTYVNVEITGTAQELGEAVIVSKTGASQYTVVARANGTLKAEDFFEKELYVKVLNTKAQNKRVYAGTDFVDGVGFASNAKKSLAVSSVDGRLAFVKAQDKPVKLTVSPADGSKDKKKNREISVNLKTYEKLGLYIEGNELHQQYTPSDTKLTYDGGMNAKFTLRLAQFVDGDWEHSYDTGYPDSSIGIKASGGKLVKDYKKAEISSYTLVMTAPAATITLTDKGDRKKAPVVYEINQNPPVDLKAAAPSITAKNKLTWADVEKQYDVENGTNGRTAADQVTVNFQVKGKGKQAQNSYARKYVYVAPDFTKTKGDVNFKAEWERARDYFLQGNKTDQPTAGTGSEASIIQLDDNSEFKLNFRLDDPEYWNTPGNYTLIATVGEYDSEGHFRALAKGVNLKINVPTKKVKRTLTVKGKYTLDAGTMNPVRLDVDNNIQTGGYDWKVIDGAGNLANNTATNYALNKINPKTGKPNNFNKYFEIRYTGTTWVLGLKKNLKKADIEYITGASKEAAADREGYVTIHSDLDGTSLIAKDMKITVAFSDRTKLVGNTKLSAVYAGETATIRIYNNADDAKARKNAITLAGAFVLEGGTLATTSKSGVENDTDIKVKLDAGAKKSTQIKLKVLAKDSAYATMEEKNKGNGIALATNYGREVVVTVTAIDKASDDKAKVYIKDSDLKVTAADYKAASGNYQINVKYDTDAEGATITGLALADSYKKKAFADKSAFAVAKSTGNQFVLTVKRNELVARAAAKGSAVKLGKQVEIPVTFRFSSTGVSSVTIPVKVMMPSPMTYEDAVEMANGDLKRKLSGMKADDLFVADRSTAETAFRARVEKVINEMVPADAMVVDRDLVWKGRVEIKDNGVSRDPQEFQYEMNLSFKKDKTAKKEDYSYSFSDIEEVFAMTPAQLKNKVKGTAGGTDLSTTAPTNITNSFTEADLMDYIKTELAKDSRDANSRVKVIPNNLMLTVRDFKLKNAKTSGNGSVTAKLIIRNRRNNPADDFDVKTATVDISYAVPAVQTLADVRTALYNTDGTDGDLANATDGSGINYSKVMSDAMSAPNATLASIQAALEKEIRDKIESVITNEEIEYSLVAANAKVTGSNSPINTNILVDFKLPTAAGSGTEGFVSFKVALSQGEKANPMTIDFSGDNKVEGQLVETKDPFQTLTAAETEAKKATTLAANATMTTTSMQAVVDQVKVEVEAKVTGKGIKVEVTGTREQGTAAGAPDAEHPDKVEKDNVVNIIVKLTDTLGRGASPSDNLKTITNGVKITE